MNTDYDIGLIKRLANKNEWTSILFKEDFRDLINKVEMELNSNTISGKIATVFVRHQATQEMLINLIELSLLYVQAEIWPTVFKPKFDGGKDKMTYWYISFYENHCIDCNGKNEYIKSVKEINRLRNKVAHNLTGKNAAIISSTFRGFDEEFQKSIETWSEECYPDLMNRIHEVTRRADFSEFLEENGF